jgi:predicted nucleic acid-binding protein
LKAFLDTSVMVAAFYGDHVHHAASLDLFTRFDKKDACCAGHSLLEVYSVLTRMPGKHRIGSEQAMLFIGNIRERLTLVALTGEEYAKALQTFADLGVAGGTIYDAHLAACALKAQATTLYTWNVGHFAQLGPKVASILKAPK